MLNACGPTAIAAVVVPLLFSGPARRLEFLLSAAYEFC
jgi:hypothetical protein